MKLAQGDTINPLAFAAYGITSPNHVAERRFEKLLSGNLAYSAAVAETLELLAHCDGELTVYIVGHPNDPDTHDVAIQGALVFPKLAQKIARAKDNTAPSRNDLVEICLIYEILLTRAMSFLMNRSFPI